METDVKRKEEDFTWKRLLLIAGVAVGFWVALTVLSSIGKCSLGTCPLNVESTASYLIFIFLCGGAGAFLMTMIT